MRLRRWIFWVTLTVVSLMTLSAVGVYLLLRGLDLAPPPVTAGTTLRVPIAGELPDDSVYDLGGFLGVERLTFRNVLDSIHRAKEDGRIEGLLLHVRGADMGWAKAEEMRSGLLEFKQSGKPLVAYIEQAGTLEYFLASAADTLYLHPQSILDLRGIQAEVTFMRSTLDKLGIEAEFEQIGPYKNAPDVYTRETLSEAHRQALEAIVDDLYQRLVSTIAQARRLSPGEVKNVLDHGPLPAGVARELRMVDDLLYIDEVEKHLETSGEKFRSVSVTGYEREARGLSLVGRPRIALIYGVGTIIGGESAEDPLFGRLMGSDTVAQAFKQVREDDSIKAVVFRIDSPGGSDVASDIIWREASLTKEKKPVVVSMANVAASGGYWIATASNAIVAEPTTLTGSIGIYGGKFNLKGLYEKIGLNEERVSRGESADFWSDARSFTEGERAKLRSILEEGYRRFLEKVAQARGKKTEEIDAVGQGRVWTGAQAREHGLVDELGGLDRALALAREKAGIAEGARVQLDIYPRRKTLLEVLRERLVQVASGDGFLVAPERLLARSPVLRLLSEGRPLALLPYEIHLH